MSSICRCNTEAWTQADPAFLLLWPNEQSISLLCVQSKITSHVFSIIFFPFHFLSPACSLLLFPHPTDSLWYCHGNQHLESCLLALFKCSPRWGSRLVRAVRANILVERCGHPSEGGGSARVVWWLRDVNPSPAVSRPWTCWTPQIIPSGWSQLRILQDEVKEMSWTEPHRSCSAC